MKKTKQITTLSAAIMFALFSLNSFTGCNPDDSPPPADDTTDTGNNSVVEYIQWNDTRIESKDFIEKRFSVNSTDSTLIVEFKQNGVPATEFQITYLHPSWSDFEFFEGEYKPTDAPLSRGTLWIKAFGFTSGTGKFNSRDSSSYDYIRVTKKNNDWVIEFKDVLLIDVADAKWTGKASGRVIWKAP